MDHDFYTIRARGF